MESVLAGSNGYVLILSSAGPLFIIFVYMGGDRRVFNNYLGVARIPAVVASLLVSIIGTFLVVPTILISSGIRGPGDSIFVLIPPADARIFYTLALALPPISLIASVAFLVTFYKMLDDIRDAIVDCDGELLDWIQYTSSRVIMSPSVAGVLLANFYSFNVVAALSRFQPYNSMIEVFPGEASIPGWFESLSYLSSTIALTSALAVAAFSFLFFILFVMSGCRRRSGYERP